MTPQDHNKTLAFIYGFLATVFVLLLCAAPLIIAQTVDEPPSSRRVEQIIYAAGGFSVVLLLTSFLLATAYGFLRTRRWVRVPALILAMIFVWIFPLGTMLVIYTWWFLHSEGAKQLYAKSRV